MSAPDDKLPENPNSESRPLEITGESAEVLTLPEREVLALPAGSHERMVGPPTPISVFIYDKERGEMIAITPEMIHRYDQKMQAAYEENQHANPIDPREPAIPLGDEAPFFEDVPPFMDDDAPPIEDGNHNNAPRQAKFSRPEERPSVKEKLDRAKAEIRQGSKAKEPQRGQRKAPTKKER